MPFSLKLLGGVSLEGGQGPQAGPAVQRHRLALLALLAAARPRAVSRDKLMAWLWPERDERARGLLNQAVHVLRRTLGVEAILSAGDDLQLNAAVVACDLIAFDEAVASGDFGRAASLYTGPFLDGFFLSDAPEFERWVDRERERLAASYGRVLESLAERAESAGDRLGAMEWWKRRVEQDPYDSRAVGRLMLALEATGNRAAALLQAETHQRLLREDLGLEAAPEIEALTGRLRGARAAAAPWLSAESAGPPVVPVGADAGAAAPGGPPAPAAGTQAPPPGYAAARPARYLRLWRYGAVAVLASGMVIAAAWLTSERVAARTGAAPVRVDEIAQAVARELARRERGDTADRRPEHRTRSVPAYELYLRGSDPTLIRSDSGARRGLEYFQRAVALDSTYAAAWAGLARMTLRATRDDDPSAADRAEAAARKAISLDDSLGEAHASLALARMSRHDLAGTESHLRHAISLDPGTGHYHEWLVRLHVWTGRPAEAVQAARRALALAPLSPSAHAELARALVANGEPDQALAELRQLVDLDPPLLRVTPIMAQGYAEKGMWDEALAITEPPGGPASPDPGGLYGYLLARAGRREDAARVLRTLMAQTADRGRREIDIALVHAGLGEPDRFAAWLERAYDNRSLIPFAEMALTLSRILEQHREHPRVAALRARLGLQSR